MHISNFNSGAKARKWCSISQRVLKWNAIPYRNRQVGLPYVALQIWVFHIIFSLVSSLQPWLKQHTRCGALRLSWCSVFTYSVRRLYVFFTLLAFLSSVCASSASSTPIMRSSFWYRRATRVVRWSFVSPVCPRALPRARSWLSCTCDPSR